MLCRYILAYGEPRALTCRQSTLPDFIYLSYLFLGSMGTVRTQQKLLVKRVWECDLADGRALRPCLR
jgi:hypothetical protein